MPRPPITWLIGDTHWYHDNIVQFENRPQNHTELSIKRWRHAVAPQDTTIHLGDVIFYQYTRLKEILDSIPGKKFLVKGNHDKKTLSWYTRNGFDCAVDTLSIDNVLFSHRPVQHFPDNVTINVHGHLHSGGHRPTESWWNPGGRHRLFVLEHHYSPICLQQFLADTEGKTFDRIIYDSQTDQDGRTTTPIPKTNG